MSPWAKLDDGLYDHPKVLEAGNEATGAYCRGLSYCGKHLTDGFIPEGAARILSDRSEIDKLIEVGLWERAEGGYQVHDYLDYNPSREKVEAERADNAERQRRWREQRRDGRSNGVTDTVSNGCPDPTRPGQTRPESPKGPGDELAEHVRGILDRGVASLSENDHGRPWPSPKLSEVRDALAEHSPEPGLAVFVAQEVREIVQAQDRAPNVAGLYAKRLAEAVAS